MIIGSGSGTAVKKPERCMSSALLGRHRRHRRHCNRRRCAASTRHERNWRPGCIRRAHGWVQVVRQVVSSSRFMLGLLFMALAFFSLLVTLSWGDVSVVGPASASLTFIANAFARRIFLKERVDHRRWLAAVFVAGGVALLAR